MGPKSRSGGGDRLCQTSPIPRSPDGDNNKVGRLFTKRTSIQLENQKSLRHYLTREALPREDHYRWLHINNPMALLIRTRGQRAEKYDVLCSPS